MWAQINKSRNIIPTKWYLNCKKKGGAVSLAFQTFMTSFYNLINMFNEKKVKPNQ